MTLPNFAIIGAGRSGTTSLWHYLRQHPDVFMSPVKEAAYFAWAAAETRGCAGRAAESALAFPVRCLEAYEALFADAAGRRAVGEATPRYLAAEGVPEAMAALVPELRLVAILREPTSRALASWMGHHAEGREQRSFEQVVEEELPKLDRPVEPGEVSHLRQGLYHRHLQRFLAVFPEERMLVLLQEDLASDPAGTMRRLLSFLDVDPDRPIDTSRRHNPTGLPRNAAIERLTAKSPLTQALKRHLPEVLREPLLNAAMRLRARNRTRPALSPALRGRLLDAYRDDTRALARWLGRDLSAWERPEG